MSYPVQTIDAVQDVPHKWASLDGSWVLDGSYHLAPAPDKLAQYQFGWWGSQLAGAGGSFAVPYPSLTVTHIARPVHTLRVTGDGARMEYPVDFTISLYAADDTLLHSESITGNNQVAWTLALPTPVLDVVRQVLTVTKWSHEGRQTKIIEFFTSIRETYLTGDLVSLRLLEEREASQGSLPVGNISANEVTLVLNNESKKFDVDNAQSPLKNLLKPNRKIQLWLGADAENIESENPPTFTRASTAYKQDGTEVASGEPRFEQDGVMVEEGTGNEILNPTFVNTSSWTLSTTGAGTFTVSDNWGKIYIPDTGKFYYVAQIIVRNTPANTKVVFSVAFKNDVVGKFALRLVMFAGAIPVQQPMVEVNLDGSGGTKRYSVVAEHTEITDKVRLDILAGSHYTSFGGLSDVSVEFTKAQFEQKPYPTSFHPTTRAAETLTIPTAGVITPTEGTIDVRCYIGEHQRRLSNQTVFMIHRGATGSNTGLAVYHSPSSTHWWLVSQNDGGTQSANAISDNLTPDGIPLLTVSWSGSLVKLYINGALVKTVENSNMPSVFNKLLLGSAFSHLNTTFHEFRASSIARTDAEIAAYGASGQPLALDAHTTYLLTFNGSLYPVERCWVPLGAFWSLDWDSPDDTLEATVTARDRMELLRKGTYQSSQVQTNVSLYTLAEQVLQDAGLLSDEYNIDPALQNIIVPYAWFNPGSHREALRLIAEAALAVAFANRDNIVEVSSFVMSGGTSDLTITEDEYFLPLRSPSKQDGVANEVIVITQPLKPATSAEEVHRSNSPITIPASGIKTITAYYNLPPVTEAAASLDSPPAGVSISGVTYYGWGAEVTIQNTNGTAQEVTLVVAGKPLTVQNKERAMAKDEANITENGVLRYEFPGNPLVQTLTQAQNIADTLLASVKDSRRDLEMDWRGNPALLLGDRITVKNQDYHVIRQEIEWAGALLARLRGRKA